MTSQEAAETLLDMYCQCQKIIAPDDLKREREATIFAIQALGNCANNAPILPPPGWKDPTISPEITD